MRHKLQLLLLGMVINSCLFAQTTERYYDYTWKICKPEEALFYSSVTKTDTGFYRRDYYLREKKLQMAGLYQDEECTIPNGTFFYFYPNAQLSASGKFKSGKKEGIWLRYHANKMLQDSAFYQHDNPMGVALSWHSNGYLSDSAIYQPDGSGLSASWFDDGMPSSAGLFSNGRQPDKKWIYFHKNGKASCIELYNKGNLTCRQHFDTSGAPLADTNDVEREAAFPGGINAWQKYLQKKLYFPPQYKFDNDGKAVVIVSFAVNEEGKIEDVYVSTSLHPTFDRIAENVVKQSPKWIPALKKNRNIKSYRRQPVTFGQQSQ